VVWDPDGSVFFCADGKGR